MSAPVRLRVPLSAFVLGATQCREETDEELVKEYAAARRAGVELPPPDVFAKLVEGALPEGAKVWIGDGEHRVLSAKYNGVAADIECYVHEGGEEEAFRYALRANRAHGKRLTNADKRHAARRAILRWPAMSSRQIAKLADLGPTLVEDVRKKLVEEGALQDGPRMGADGKKRALPQTEPAEDPRRVGLFPVGMTAPAPAPEPPATYEPIMAGAPGEALAGLPLRSGPAARTIEQDAPTPEIAPTPVAAEPPPAPAGDRPAAAPAEHGDEAPAVARQEVEDAARRGYELGQRELLERVAGWLELELPEDQEDAELRVEERIDALKLAEMQAAERPAERSAFFQQMGELKVKGLVDVACPQCHAPAGEFCQPCGLRKIAARKAAEQEAPAATPQKVRRASVEIVGSQIRVIVRGVEYVRRDDAQAALDAAEAKAPGLVVNRVAVRSLGEEGAEYYSGAIIIHAAESVQKAALEQAESAARAALVAEGYVLDAPAAPEEQEEQPAAAAKPDRLTLSCARCKVPAGQPCKNYKGHKKPPCRDRGAPVQDDDEEPGEEPAAAAEGDEPDPTLVRAAEDLALKHSGERKTALNWSAPQRKKFLELLDADPAQVPTEQADRLHHTYQNAFLKAKAVTPTKAVRP